MGTGSFPRLVLQDFTTLLLSLDGRALEDGIHTGLVRAKRVAPTASGL